MSNPTLYKTIFGNDRVQVLDFNDKPGDITPHRHPDSVMYTLSSFKRRLSSNGRVADGELEAGSPCWLSAQEHSGENIGQTATRVTSSNSRSPFLESDNCRSRARAESAS